MLDILPVAELPSTPHHLLQTQSNDRARSNSAGSSQSHDNPGHNGSKLSQSQRDIEGLTSRPRASLIDSDGLIALQIPQSSRYFLDIRLRFDLNDEAFEDFVGSAVGVILVD